MSEIIGYIGECQHDDCTEEATRWIAVEYITTALLSDEKRLFEDHGYLCDDHAEWARESSWHVVEDKPAVTEKEDKNEFE